MRRLASALVLGFMLVTGCAYTVRESRIEAIPDQYQEHVTPALLRSYFEVSGGPHGWKYENPQASGDTVVATIIGPASLEVGTVTAQILNSSQGKTVLVTLKVADNVYWEDDVEYIRKELYRHILGGRAPASR